MEVFFYTRKKCPLCEEAKLNLQLVSEDIEIKIHEIDIETDDQLIEEYGLMIPVVKCQGNLIQYGQVDYVTLRNRLQEFV
ncbi:glutaredoxin family protein [Oikeobacillus pervagus]|nr:glutaredoxin family protein [Oikeobacillus pervagus]